jgi:AmmeMemoRadiSam system protein B
VSGRRAAAVAGTWYPSHPAALRQAVDAYLAAAEDAAPAMPPGVHVRALVAPHAGLMYSGPVAAHAYRLVAGTAPAAVVLVGPSHHVAFEGVAVWPEGAFETPLGDVPIAAPLAQRVLAACPLVHERPAAHLSEHALEMQLPFVAALLPGVPIVPLVMGRQSAATMRGLAAGLSDACSGRDVLLVASSDLSHYEPREVAAAMDGAVASCVDAFDDAGLERLLAREPNHACGGGAMVAVLAAARALGAGAARVLHYGDSGDVSGDTGAVVGYMAAAAWASSGRPAGAALEVPR